MTKHEISQYRHLNREVEMLEARKRGLLEDARKYRRHDAVKASMQSTPYAITTQRVDGISVYDMPEKLLRDVEEVIATLGARRAQCLSLRLRIEKFIDTVPDSRMRMILAYRYINGLPWSQVAANIGYQETEGTVRLADHRFWKLETNVTKTCDTI